LTIVGIAFGWTVDELMPAFTGRRYGREVGGPGNIDLFALGFQGFCSGADFRMVDHKTGELAFKRSCLSLGRNGEQQQARNAKPNTPGSDQNLASGDIPRDSASLMRTRLRVKPVPG